MNKTLTAILAAILTLTMLSACGPTSNHSAKEDLPKPENNSGNSTITEPPPTEDSKTSTTAYKEFPKPIGNYTVGRTQMDFKYTASDHSERELTALFFYPSDSDEGKPTAEYAFPEFHSLRNELLAKLGAPTGEPLFDSDFKTWTYEDLTLSKKEQQYPVLFFVHGAGAYPQQGTLFAQDLASSGYIVVSIGHAESGVYKLKDGRTMAMTEQFMTELTKYGMEAATLTPPEIVTNKLGEEAAMEISRKLTSAPEATKFSKYAVLQSEDVSYVADHLYKMNAGELDSEFEGRLQLDIGMGVFGHSFGGTTAAIVSRDDERFVGAVNLDGNMVGALDSDLKKPYMQLGTVLAHNTNAFLLETNSDDTYFAIIDDVIHGDFSDSMFTTTNQATRGTRDAMEQRDIITSYTKAFFDRYLLKQEADIESLTFDGVEMIKKP
ncbi:alpha/beta hydrolase [Paenibacillus senegalimassiliensis]|uniref:alpha/beta hydrolase n=1 Tax=Paenibacillus senegalimassiliensis TaxID=1737426 RepID=UPI000ACBC4A0|nr:choline esterase [Paenibacillus senegalimassiliensis]